MSGTRPRDIEALILLIEDRAALSFGWRGKRDCAGFAAAAIEAQTGVDVLAGLSWSTRGGALAVLDAEGGMETAMDRRMARVAPALAMRGDIAGVPDPLTGLRLMVVEGAMLVGPGAAGLERQPRCAMTIAWDVTTRSEEPTSE